MKNWLKNLLAAILIIISINLLQNLVEAGRYNNGNYVRRSKQDRPIRAGFKSSTLTLARNFGKRNEENNLFLANIPLQEDRMYSLPNDNEILIGESFPIEWFAEEMKNNPTLTKTILHKFVDIDGDGYLTPNELLRTSSL